MDILFSIISKMFVEIIKTVVKEKGKVAFSDDMIGEIYKSATVSLAGTVSEQVLNKDTIAGIKKWGNKLSKRRRQDELDAYGWASDCFDLSEKKNYDILQYIIDCLKKGTFDSRDRFIAGYWDGLEQFRIRQGYYELSEMLSAQIHDAFIDIAGNIYDAIMMSRDLGLELQVKTLDTIEQTGKKVEEVEKLLKPDSPKWLGYDIEPLSMKCLGSQSKTFIPRPQYIAGIRESLRSDENGKHILFIRGMGGMGKSELVREYAHESHALYQNIILFVCTDDNAPELNILIDSYEKTTGVKNITEMLSESDHSVLLIIDNFNFKGALAFLDSLQRKTGKADVLITTRLPYLKNVNTDFGDWIDLETSTYLVFGKPPVEITTDDDNAAFLREVFKSNYEHPCTIENTGRKRVLNEKDMSCIDEICRIVGFNTMAVSLTALHLREYYEGTFGDFVATLKQDIKTAFPDDTVIDSINYNLNEEQEKGIYRILKDVILEKLFCFIEDRDLRSEELQLLSLLSLVPAQSVREVFLYEVLGDTESQHRIKNSTRRLIDLGWIREKSGSFIMHPLIAEFFSEYLEDDEKDRAYKDVRFYVHVLENFLADISQESEFPDENIIRAILDTVNPLYKRERDKPKTILIADLILSKYTVFDNLHIISVLSDHKGLLVLLKYKYGSKYAFYNLRTKKMKMFIDLSFRSYENRYWGNPDIGNVQDKNNDIIKSSILGYFGDMDTNLKLPDTILHKPIDVFHAAFIGCKGLTGPLTIPDSATSIGNWAFFACIKSTGSLIIPDSVTSIGEWAFYCCDGLTGPLTIPDSVISIGTGAFCGCFRFSGPLIIPDSVTSIGDGAFYGCRGLTGSLIIPDSVNSIGDRTFHNCIGFTGPLILPDSVTSIGDLAFYGCEGFTGSLILPNSVISIGDLAFYGCKGLSGLLMIPDSVTSIGKGAFCECGGLTGSLTIPDSVTSIGDLAFYGCSGLTGSLTIPDSVNHMGDGAFCGCSGLTGLLVIPDSVNNIGDRAFFGCSGFSGSLMIPNSITRIGCFAFAGCTGLSGILEIPGSVDYIGQDAFEECQFDKIIFFNPKVDLSDLTEVDHSTIIAGYPGSTAEEFAIKYLYIFEPIS